MRTVDIDHAIALADQALRGPENVPQADAQADLLHHLVGVLGVDVVLDGDVALLPEVVGRNLHQVGYLGLEGRAG